MAAADFETRIRVKSHAAKCVEEINSLWKSGKFCDLTLKVGGFEFKVHKIILASCSKYFKNMFTEERFIESDKNFVELFEVNVDAFKIILNYFYSGYIALTQNSVELVLRTADFFGLTAIKSICYKYLLENTGVENCVKRYLLGVKIGFKSLKSQSKSVILQQLDEVSKTNEFLAINQDTLKEILTSEEDNHKAEDLYNAIIEWVKYDLDNRKSLLSDLLLLFPTEQISYDFYIENMKNNEILRQDLKCTSWLLDNFLERFVNNNPCASCYGTSIFITSRVENNPLCYNIKPGSSGFVCLPPRSDVIRFSAVYYKNCIYLVTGEFNEQNIERSLKYSTSEGKWSEIDLSFDRCNSGACILRDQLYIIGGFNNSKKSFLKSCVCYDFNSKSKCTMADMKEKKRLPGTGVYENSIYACCGISDVGELSNIQRYDPREGFWSDVGNYNVAKGLASATVISTSLYTSILEKEIFERFDFRNNRSEELAKPNGNNGAWITSANRKLFRAHEKGISEYNIDSNQWSITEYGLIFNRPIVLAWDSM